MLLKNYKSFLNLLKKHYNQCFPMTCLLYVMEPDPSLDEARLLRDQSKRIIASLQLKYAEETNIKNIKIKHNNHLGYFIEVTSSNAKILTKDFESKDRFIHRQTMANLTRFTTLELIDLEDRITNATNRALSIELEAFETLSKAIIEHSESLNDASKVIDVIMYQLL